MKRQLIVFSLVTVFLSGAFARGQAPAQIPPEAQRKLQEALQQLKYTEAAQQQIPRRGERGAIGTIRLNVGGAWWTNTNLVTQLGLTDDQKTKIEKAYESHQQDLQTRSKQVDSEEAQLAKLLAADPLDKNAILSEIDRVVQARGELERVNSAMTLEMREVLTASQWAQLQLQSIWIENPLNAGPIRTPFGTIANPNPTPAGGGGRGQRSGPGQRQQ